MILKKVNSVFPVNSIDRDVAYMIATSHEYKTPNEDGAIKLVKNYKWELRNMKIDKLQGINKPVNKEKVFDIAKKLKIEKMTPFMVVDKFQGIKPQSQGSKILLDGHHRKEACDMKGIKDVPVYYGTYTGGSEKSIEELINKKANDILCGIEKKANEDNENSNAKRLALGATGVGAIGASKNMILGKKTMYHGTSKTNWDKIKTEGLKANKGGVGGASAAINDLGYIDASKNNIHATRFKGVANMYSHINSDNTKPTSKSMLSQGKDGKVFKMNMDYNKFKKMRIDNVGDDDISDIPKIFRGAAKNMAAKGNINVSPEEISGSKAKLVDKAKHTMKALPGYIKSNPVRFGAGVALAGGGAYMLNRSMKDKKEKTAEDYYYEIIKEASLK